MAKVIRHQTSKLTPGNRRAIADFVMSLNGIDHDPYREAEGECFGE